MKRRSILPESDIFFASSPFKVLFVLFCCFVVLLFCCFVVLLFVVCFFVWSLLLWLDDADICLNGK